MKRLQRFVTNMLADNRMRRDYERPATINDVDPNYEILNQYNLGDAKDPSKKPRSRQQIYGMWTLMMADPQISEAMGLHVTAALGGHETNGDTIFISPHPRVRGKGRRASELRKKVEAEAKHIAPILNRNAFSLCLRAITFGDSYGRIYSDSRIGVYGLSVNRSTTPSLIMPFEQGDKTIGFHALEDESTDKAITKLTPKQLLRVKMPRTLEVPQVTLDVWKNNKVLVHDIRSNCPVLPSEVGGSFLYPIEEPWKDVTISRVGLNNQQIADSVRQAFLSMNMEGMPPAQQKKYRRGLETILSNYRNRIEEAFKGGEALHGTQYHILPQWSEKQIVQSVGDLSQRNSPLNDSTLMLNLRRLAGGLGMDLSLIGWADMLAGGLGDGAAFYTSAQIMRRSTLIRQALIDAGNHLMSIHWGLKYDEYFKEDQYPWQFDFYSDQNAAATQALSNKQNRANTTMMTTQAIMALKELGLGREVNQLILEDDLGMDMDRATKVAEALDKKADAEAATLHGEGATPQAGQDDDQSQGDDEGLPDDEGWDDDDEE
ncbi:MAG: hypothetical protein Q4P13_05910 [Psychrobacter sp.]|nr:hypothetical protein [Psychrobacter sp.]